MCIEKKRLDFSLLVYSIPRPKRAAYAPPDPVLMEKARQVRMNEIKMWSVIREILFYSFFLWILMVISYRNRSQLMYTYKNSMEQVFIVTNNTNHSFMKVNSWSIHIHYMKQGLLMPETIKLGYYFVKRQFMTFISDSQKHHLIRLKNTMAEYNYLDL